MSFTYRYNPISDTFDIIEDTEFAGASEWGQIIGSLANQPDLQAVLDAKADTNALHTQNQDTKLAEGSGDEVSASELRSAIDTEIPAKIDKLNEVVDTRLLLNFEVVDGDTTAEDESGKHSISINGAAQLDDAEKKFGSTSLLIPSGGSASIADSPDWDLWTIDGEKTFSFFFKPNTTPPGSGNDQVFFVQYVDSNHNWVIQLRPNDFSVRIRDTDSLGTILIETPTKITDTNWHHAVVYIKDGTIALYLDGNQETYRASVISSNVSLSTSLLIGTHPNGDQFGFKGWLDAVRYTDGNPLGLNPDAGNTDSYMVPTTAPVFTEASKQIAHVDVNGNLVRSNLVQKVIEIGDWNLDADNIKSVPHNLPGETWKKIRSANYIIRNDDDSVRYTANVKILALDITATSFDLFRENGSFMDSTSFDSTSYNRGWITFTYEI